MPDKKLHEMRPGELSGPGHEITQVFIDNEVKRQCQLFDLSQNATHLWRAWRTARAAGEVSQFCLEWLMPRLDQLANLPVNVSRANLREQRFTRLLDYYHELELMREKRPGCAKSKTEARDRVAGRHATTGGAIKKMVLDFEASSQQDKGMFSTW